MAELGLQESQIQRGVVEASPFRVEVEGYLGLRVRGEVGEAVLVLQAREVVVGAQHFQAKEVELV